MLFLLKRTWQGGLAATLILIALAWPLRGLLTGAPAWEINPAAVRQALIAFAVILASDALLHLTYSITLGQRYWHRYFELAHLFHRQKLSAMLAGSLMAGLGEESLFRGLSSNPLLLALAAVLFGLLHHVRRSLWLFTFWSIYQGMLLAGAMYLTGNLFVPMLAHFLHDFTGFLIFRYGPNRAPGR
jgi:membrane protease YdiL (CAAX protease family)